MTSALFSHLLACHGVSLSQNAVKSQRTATQPCGNTTDESTNNGGRKDAGNRMKMSVTVNKGRSLDVSSCAFWKRKRDREVIALMMGKRGFYESLYYNGLRDPPLIAKKKKQPLKYQIDTSWFFIFLWQLILHKSSSW